MAFCFAYTCIQTNYSCRQPDCQYRTRIAAVKLPKELNEGGLPRPCCILKRMFECAKNIMWLNVTERLGQLGNRSMPSSSAVSANFFSRMSAQDFSPSRTMRSRRFLSLPIFSYSFSTASTYFCGMPIQSPPYTSIFRCKRPISVSVAVTSLRRSFSLGFIDRPLSSACNPLTSSSNSFS